MEHTITSLAKKARVTARTLRHYDQIGLLKPQVRMANGRRIYGDAELMRLSEIVFFKKIGLGLAKIRDIFAAKDCSKAASAALCARKAAIAKETKRLQSHAMSIDMVLPQYKNNTLSQKERLAQFSSYLKLVKEVEAIQKQESGEKTFAQMRSRMETLSEEEVDAVTDRSYRIMRQLVQAAEKGLDPYSAEVQKLIQQHCALIAEFHVLTIEVLSKLRDSILERKECYAVYHPKYPEFLYQAFDAFIIAYKQKRST